MKSLHYLIVEVESSYNNQTNSGIITNTSIESVENITREATVVTAPDFTVLKKGQKVLVHHNIFREKYSMTGILIKGDYHIKDNLYFVPLTEIFMYKDITSDWFALDPFCFVKPIRKGSEKFIGQKILYKERQNQVGELLYIPPSLTNQGLKKGDKIIFSKNSEYEFSIDNEILYKMSSKDILIKLNESII